MRVPGRQSIISRLIKDDYDTIVNHDSDLQYIEMLMRNGFVGYDNQTDDDLKKEYKERFQDAE